LSWLEHPAHNRVVPGSSPGGPTTPILRQRRRPAAVGFTVSAGFVCSPLVMQGIEKKERELILELSRIESRIAEIQSLIDYLPADLAEFHKESLRLQKLIDQIHAKKERVLQKVGECTRLESIEQENLDKTARLLKITRDQKVHNSAKRYEDQTRKI
ncbi:hypothetical protein CHS0354_035225, partial [Potamilus streckersoni]